MATRILGHNSSLGISPVPLGESLLYKHPMCELAASGEEVRHGYEEMCSSCMLMPGTGKELL
jgi:hypothetical protein